MAGAKKRRMTFRKFGRAYQVSLDTAEDLRYLQNLDESLWMAMSAPIEGIVCDRVFLELMDFDHNGVIHCGEVRTAIAWLLHRLANLSRVGQDTTALRLADINVEHAERQRLRAAAERILSNLGQDGAEEISLGQVRDQKKILSAEDANGDGIIPPSAAASEDTAALLKDILETIGGATDASGKSGVTESGLATFLKEADAYLSWLAKGRIPEGEERTEVMPLGGETAAAHAAYVAINVKVDEFFRACATVRYEPASAEQFRLQTQREAGEGLAQVLESRLQEAPIATPNADGLLNLDGPLNPVYAAALGALRGKVLCPVLGAEVTSFSEDQWRQVCARLTAHGKWKAEEPETKVGSLGEEKLRRYTAPEPREAVQALIEADKAVAKAIEASREVEKLVLYQRWLLEFANNFANFSRLYNPEIRALFEIGTLVMDGRHFALTVRVPNRAAHAKVAKQSRLFVLYIELTQSKTGKKSEVATAVTTGGMGNLYVGKQGLFIARDGEHWGAKVTQVIDNPISIREALLMPFRRIGQMIQSQVDKFSGSGQKLMEQKVTKQVGEAATTAQAAAQKPGQISAPAARKARPAGGGAAGLLIGGGVAFAALGSAFAYIANKLEGVEFSTIMKLVSLVVLAVVVPTVINAWIKLRRRDVGTLLEASGWAINGRMRLTRKLQHVFTRRPLIPAGARKERFDQLSKYRRFATQPLMKMGKEIAEFGKDISETL